MQVDKDHSVINHPQHYTMGKYEVIDVIEDWKLPYHLGNVIKYVARSPYKGRQLDDLKKARWYLDRYIQLLEPAVTFSQGGELLPTTDCIISNNDYWRDEYDKGLISYLAGTVEVGP